MEPNESVKFDTLAPVDLAGAGKSKVDGGGASKLPLAAPFGGGARNDDDPVAGGSRFFFGYIRQ